MPPREAENSIWAYAKGRSDTAKMRAIKRLAVLRRIEELTAQGRTKTAAIALVSKEANQGSSTLWSWLRHANGVMPKDRLPALVPKFRGGGRRAEIDEGVYRNLIAVYLFDAKITWSKCCQRHREAAKAVGVNLPHNRTLWRRFAKELSGSKIQIKPNRSI